MKALEERNAARGLRVVGVTRDGEDDKERAEVERVAAEHGMTAPSYLDTSGEWLGSAGVKFAPAFLLLDREGRLAYRHTGVLKVDSAEFAEMMAIVEKM